jgi:4-amino-4-deoxy-L-arabinose transferase-like glycosyltransferase
MTETVDHSAPRAFRVHTVVILLATTILRVAWVCLVPVVPSSDSILYHTAARMLVTEGVYGWTPGQPTAYWPPGTSFIYAALYWLFGVSYLPVVVLNIALGVGIVALTIALTGGVLGRRPAMVAGWLTALWPIHVEFTTVLASELPFTFFLLAAVVWWLRLADRPVVRAVGAGVLFAAASYVRPTALLVPPLLAGIEFLQGPRRSRTFWTAALLGLVMAMAIAPWTIRNARVFGRFVPISTNGGSNLWMGNNPETTGFYQDVPQFPGLNEAEADAERGRIARRYIAEHPAAFTARTAVKLARLHERQTIGVVWNGGLTGVMPERGILALKLLGQAYWIAVLSLGAIGGVLLALRAGLIGAASNPLVFLWAYFAIAHAVIVIQDRYTFVFTPMIAGLGGLTVVTAMGRWGRARGRPV